MQKILLYSLLFSIDFVEHTKRETISPSSLHAIPSKQNISNQPSSSSQMPNTVCFHLLNHGKKLLKMIMYKCLIREWNRLKK